MTAKEMFEKLGYEQELIYDLEFKKRLIAIRYKRKKYIIIDFDLLDGDFVKYGKIWEVISSCSITIEELQAINKQVEELGWLRGENNE